MSTGLDWLNESLFVVYFVYILHPNLTIPRFFFFPFWHHPYPVASWMSALVSAVILDVWGMRRDTKPPSAESVSGIRTWQRKCRHGWAGCCFSEAQIILATMSRNPKRLLAECVFVFFSACVWMWVCVCHPFHYMLDFLLMRWCHQCALWPPTD